MNVEISVCIMIVDSQHPTARYHRECIKPKSVLTTKRFFALFVCLYVQVPWSRLGQEPVVVLLDRIYLLAEPATNLDAGDDSGDAVQEAKMKRVKVHA